jgi:hypothetical protein
VRQRWRGTKTLICKIIMKIKYSYLIYKIYSWRNDTPIINTILTLGIIHFIHFFMILLFIDRVITPLEGLWDINPKYLFVGMLIYFVLLYFLLYNKNRWNSYIEEFSKESERDRKRGNFFVIFFY